MRSKLHTIALALLLTVTAATHAENWTHPLQNWAKLESPLVEVTPFVFNEKLYLMESWQKQWESPNDNDGSHFTKDEIRIRDMAADRIISTPLIGHGLGMTFIWEDTVYVFAGYWGTERKWGIHDILITSSTDLKTWTKPRKVLHTQDSEKFFNISVCRGKDQFIMLVESNDPKWPAFTFKYFTSQDLKNWKQIPGALYCTKKYVGGPALYYEGGTYYTLYLQSLGGGSYETRITRSQDLIHWEDAPEGRPFVTFQPENKVHPLRPSDLREKNASDAEICYWQGRTIVYYTGGEQHYAGDLQYADYPGTPRELLEHFFSHYPTPLRSSLHAP
jgi:alpha-L-fucosidase